MAAARSSLAQAELFAEEIDCAIPGLKYQTDFLSRAEEGSLLEGIRILPLKEAEYRQWRAHRRTVRYGGKYDFTANELVPAAPLPALLYALREHLAAWVGIAACAFNHALIAEYRAGTQFGWHRDVPNFESDVGVSLAGATRLRVRRYPPVAGRRKSAFALDLAPRSVHALQGAARWDWQHAVAATQTFRYSITFRTLSASEKPAHRLKPSA